MPGVRVYPSTVDNASVTESNGRQPDALPDPDPPALPDVTTDEQESGWGERDEDSERDEWFRRERPPHHE
jgi:hypothetical protein